MKAVATTLIALVLFGTGCQPGKATYYEAGQQRKSAVGYGLGRALLPGMLCLIGTSMYNKTDKAKAVQVLVFTGAFVSIGAWDDKKEAKQIIIGFGASGIGIGAGALYKQVTK